MVNKELQEVKKVGFVGFSPLVQQKLQDSIIEQVQFRTVLSVQTGLKEINHSKNCNFTCGLEQLRAGHLKFQELPYEPLYQQLLIYLSDDLHRILGMMMRQGIDSHSFNYTEMMMLYYKLVDTCLTLLKKTKPDLIVFRTIPHFVADYLLFQIAKYLNIKTITLERVEAFDAVYLIDDIDKKNPIITGIYDNPTFDEKLEKLINSTRKMQSFKPSYFIKSSKQRKFNQSLIGLIMWTFYELSKGVVGFFIGKKMIRALKKSSGDNKSEISYWEVFIEKFLARIKTISLRRKYEKLARSKPNGKYFLFAANYQPERTTIPDAGKHWHFEQIITDISQKLPDGVKLLVREHPTIFTLPGKVHFRGSLYRTKQSYEIISKLPNVIIASCKTDIEPLIKNSVAVISLTGTVAYQANMAGKPAFLFGSRWFSRSKSIHRYENHESLNTFIKSALNDEYTDNLEDWYDLFYELKSSLIPVPNVLDADLFAQTSEAYVKSLSELIKVGNENEQK